MIRLSARIIGSLVVAFWSLMLIGAAVDDSDEPWTWEGVGVVTLYIASVISFAIAYKRELAGGIMLVVCAIAYCIFVLLSAGRNHAFAMLVSGGPYLLVGVLFLLSWRRSKRVDS